MKKLIIGFILGAILFTGVGVLASQLFARDIIYGNTNVESALNDLYTKANKTPTQVATLTTQGATYTMQNDGYITGTIRSLNGLGAQVFNDSENIVYTHYANEGIQPISIYASKGTVVSTRSNGGTYNLTVYEWK